MTTRAAVIIAVGLVLASFINGMLPRFEIIATPTGEAELNAKYVVLDRWTGTTRYCAAARCYGK